MPAKSSRILIHASLDFKEEMLAAKAEMERTLGIRVTLPELTRYQHIRDVDGDDAEFTRIKNRLTVENMNNVRESDALFILNYSHRGITNYVGGNSFMEMCVAFYLGKPIYLLHDVPEGMPYTEEIKALSPTVVGCVDDLKHFLDR